MKLIKLARVKASQWTFVPLCPEGLSLRVAIYSANVPKKGFHERQLGGEQHWPWFIVQKTKQTNKQKLSVFETIECDKGSFSQR